MTEQRDLIDAVSDCARALDAIAGAAGEQDDDALSRARALALERERVTMWSTVYSAMFVELFIAGQRGGPTYGRAQMSLEEAERISREHADRQVRALEHRFSGRYVRYISVQDQRESAPPCNCGHSAHAHDTPGTECSVIGCACCSYTPPSPLSDLAMCECGHTKQWHHATIKLAPGLDFEKHPTGSCGASACACTTFRLANAR
jgi:hypothetical protein